MAPIDHPFTHEAVVASLVRRSSVSDNLTPTSEQRTTLFVLLGYVIFITIAWNVWGLKHLIYPWKLFTVALVGFPCTLALLVGVRDHATCLRRTCLSFSADL